jgi:FtsP/CotA-like multicopper oxidase with cupredoxin domain
MATVSLHAVNENGRDTFGYNGATVPPVIRVSPGDVLKINYFNDLPAHSPESCAIQPCMGMTNLHFHGMTVSPNAPQDDVLGACQAW